MCGPASACATIKVIVDTTAGEIRSITVHREGLWHDICTLLGNLFDQFAVDWPRLFVHYAAIAFIAIDPVVDVAFDQSLLANGAPKSKVHGFVMCLAQWDCCGHSSVSAAGFPGGTRGDSVCTTREAWVSREGVTPD